MITDDERRKMAQKIRELPNSATWTADRIGEALLHLLVYGDGRKSLNLLADLIEPGEPKAKCVAEVKVDGEQLEKLAHDAAVELAGIDRDALLALADELEEVACWEVQSTGDNNRAWMLKGVCDRIREALGVSDD